MDSNPVVQVDTLLTL